MDNKWHIILIKELYFLYRMSLFINLPEVMFFLIYNLFLPYKLISLFSYNSFLLLKIV